MEAKQLFEELDYIQIRNDDDYLIYVREISPQVKKIVDFSYQLRNVNVHFNIEGTVPSINMNLWKAMNRQLEELGWLEEER